MCNKNYRIYIKLRPLYCPLLLVLTWLMAGVGNPGFFHAANFFIVIRQTAFIGILALAMSITVIIGGIDFSVAGSAALSSAVSVMLMSAGVPILVAVLIALSAAAGCGLLNGVLLAYTTIAPYYLTIGTMTLFFGMASVLRNKIPVVSFPEYFSLIGKGYLGIVPISVVLLLLIYVGIWVILNYTYHGRYLFALGSNPAGLTFVGINIRKYKITAYVLTALLSGIAGIILTSRNNYVDTSENFSYIVDTIFAITLGGANLQGSTARISGIFLGSLTVCSVSKSLNMFKVSSSMQSIIQCLLFILTIIVDNYFTSRFFRTRFPAEQE